MSGLVHSAASGSIPVPDMSSLIARLEAAAGGSQALTDDTLRAMGFTTKRYPMDSDRYWIVPGDERHPLPPWCDKITVSLDAALALAERVLELRGPININVCLAGSAQAQIYPDDPCGVHVQAVASSPALALCIAILKAKAQGEGNG